MEQRQGINVGDAVGWDGKINIQSDSELSLKGSDDYRYPGVRKIYDFELTKPDESNFKEYTMESIVFSFALMSFFSACKFSS